MKKNGKIRLYTSLINTRINELNDLVWEVEFPNGLTFFNQKIFITSFCTETFKFAVEKIHIDVEAVVAEY